MCARVCMACICTCVNQCPHACVCVSCVCMNVCVSVCVLFVSTRGSRHSQLSRTREPCLYSKKPGATLYKGLMYSGSPVTRVIPTRIQDLVTLTLGPNFHLMTPLLHFITASTNTDLKRWTQTPQATQEMAVVGRSTPGFREENKSEEENSNGSQIFPGIVLLKYTATS